ncbi:MAG: 5-(carboxyamino)imidazole ribonucleotide synthase [Planctomycetota bacterium]|nr:5-(carboxyamino)imidazole ribonucleotide synthase [Planctomycetota bacterium]
MTATKIGVLGGGQLGQMLGLSAIPLGIECVFYDPSPDAPARVAGRHISAAWSDREALAEFAASVERITFEFENVPAASLAFLAERKPVFPGVRSLELTCDRIREKEFLRGAGVPVQPFAAVTVRSELDLALATVGTHGVLKTRTLGYDGKGQRVVHSADELARAWDSLDHAPCIYEAFVPFDREVSVVATRGADGEIAAYPVVENLHTQGILFRSIAPARVSDGLARAAEGHARRVLEALGHVGTLALEMFVADGTLVANEVAPRVHNSGHWTIHGARTSQFENHMRAVAGLPLGDTGMAELSAMVNFVGGLPTREEILAIPGASLQLYGKNPRPGRKVAHVGIVAPTRAELDERLARVEGVARRVNRLAPALSEASRTA